MSTSASGARIQGDDFQHLYGWYQALRVLVPDGDVSRVEIESADAGNVDDVVIRRTLAPDEYTQVKYSVDASTPITSEWFTTAATTKGKSPLQRFCASWQQLKTEGRSPVLTLFTNKVLDPEDAILKLRGGLRATVGERLQAEPPGSKARKQLTKWARHAGVDDGQLIELLLRLGIRTDQGSWTGLIEATRDRMGFLGLKTSDLDAETGVATVRNWVKTGVRAISRDEILSEVDRRGLRADRRYVTLLVEAIDHAPWPETAQARLNWVHLFAGDEPRARRQLLDPSGWSAKLRPELVEAARALGAPGGSRVVVRGYMRLPLWFLCGIELPDIRGHHVACIQRGQWWTSDATPVSFPLTEQATELGQGPDVAIGLSVTNSIAADVRAHCTRSALPVGKYIDLSPAAGIGPTAIADGVAGLSWAHSVRDAARGAVRNLGSRRVHLFISGPAGGALLLGHVWNRVGPTIVYEDLSPGYAPTFEIPG